MNCNPELISRQTPARLVKLGLLCFTLMAPAWAQTPAKPNIIFIMADDMGYNDVGCNGQKLIHTPHIDQLAREGMRFTQYYAGSSVCAPSRASLMTGLHTGHTYIRGNYDYETEGNLPIPDSTVTLPELLKTRGYHTAMIGKWGLGGPRSVGGPNRQGFDYSLGYLDQRKAHEYYPPYLWENEKNYPIPGNQNRAENDETPGTYSHDVFASAALNYIRANKANPFFLYLPFTIPHAKLEVPSDAPYSNETWTKPQKNYAAMITRLDGTVGQIMALLKELNLDTNTIVFFCSDNGPVKAVSDHFDSNGPFRGYKLDLYEGGIREPMIARWPTHIKANSETTHPTAAWDVLPTLCELTGAPVTGKVDGLSVLPVLFGQKPTRLHDYLYWEYFEINYNWNKPDNKRPRVYLDKQAIRMGNWKGVRANLLDHPDQPLELYDLKNDVGETTDVSAQQPDVVRKLTQLLKAARTEGDFFKASPNQLLTGK